MRSMRQEVDGKILCTRKIVWILMKCFYLHSIGHDKYFFNRYVVGLWAVLCLFAENSYGLWTSVDSSNRHFCHLLIVHDTIIKTERQHMQKLFLFDWFNMKAYVYSWFNIQIAFLYVIFVSIKLWTILTLAGQHYQNQEA